MVFARDAACMQDSCLFRVCMGSILSYAMTAFEEPATMAECSQSFLPLYAAMALLKEGCARFLFTRVAVRWTELNSV